MTLVTTVMSARRKPTTGYAPVNGINLYYEVNGGGEPLVLLHGAFMTITNNWDGWISELSNTRKVVAVEMQGHGRTADAPQRDITSANLADDVAVLLGHLKIAGADLIGYSIGGAVSSTLRSDGVVTEGLEALRKITAGSSTAHPWKPSTRN